MKMKLFGSLTHSMDAFREFSRKPVSNSTYRLHLQRFIYLRIIPKIEYNEKEQKMVIIFLDSLCISFSRSTRLHS